MMRSMGAHDGQTAFSRVRRMITENLRAKNIPGPAIKPGTRAGTRGMLVARTVCPLRYKEPPLNGLGL